MQFSIVNYNDLENTASRLDAEYYKPKYLALYNKLIQILHSQIGDFSYVTDGIHNSIKFNEDSNILLFSAKVPKENYFALSDIERIDEQQDSENPRTSLRVNDVIVSSVGTIGNCAVVDESVLPANCDRHVLFVLKKISSQDFFQLFYCQSMDASKLYESQRAMFN